MSDELISDLTLEFLMNRNQYARYIKSKNNNSISNTNNMTNKKDKKFYKRRIFDLTKQLLNNETPENMLPDVVVAFDSYIKICINYFKVLDKTDIIQEDYINTTNPDMNLDVYIDIDNIVTSINNDNNDDDDHDNNDNKQSPASFQKEIDTLFMRSIKIVEPNSLEKLVKRKSLILKKKQFIPLQKDINLKDPSLKNKGIIKKNNNSNNSNNNNINNTYEEKNTNEIEKIESTEEN